MKISYNWIKDYLDIDIDSNKLAEILTDIGLEVEGIEKFESIQGGLKGVVIGKVLTCEQHPNADKLSITTVDVGNETPLDIVCGASNVAAGQKVAVATVGTTLHFDEDKLVIKKAKIRGQKSEGMICAEDELGLGKSHDGIMVLADDVEIGLSAAKYFDIYQDIVYEIGLTPNRIDGASHIGVARDLAARLRLTKPIEVSKPDVSNFKSDNNNLNISVNINNTEACPRYSGLTISGITVSESPVWLQNKLKAIGLKPINNVVDITNFVLHETGQPLHAFDAELITGQVVEVRTIADNTPFITLDGNERKLSAQDLMICNAEGGMCIAGVFGGHKSGVSVTTKSIFLESAYFNPVWVRKTAKRHGLNTDSSFRFERGADPNATIYALKRAAMLIKEIAGGQISSEIVDVYPNKIKDYDVEVSYTNVDRLIGKKIERETIKNILQSLDIQIVEENDDVLKLKVATYRVDVLREADVVEEILRIYGYNNVEIPTTIQSTLSYVPQPDADKLHQMVSNFLASRGFCEAMTNSLTKIEYYTDNEVYPEEKCVRLHNPISADMNVMRQTMLYNMLESVGFNLNHRNTDIKLFEFGKVYFYNKQKEASDKFLAPYNEEMRFSIALSGNKAPENWCTKESPTDFYTMKNNIEAVLKRLGFDIANISITESISGAFSYGITYEIANKPIAWFGAVSKKELRKFDISQDVYYAEFAWETILDKLPKAKKFKEISKFPEVRRDLSLLVDSNVRFEQIETLASKKERKLLKNVDIFDVYEGKNIEQGKKSYAVSFILQDENKTLTDKQIDKVMKKMIHAFKTELSASIR